MRIVWLETAERSSRMIVHVVEAMRLSYDVLEKMFTKRSVAVEKNKKERKNKSNENCNGHTE